MVNGNKKRKIIITSLLATLVVTTIIGLITLNFSKTKKSLPGISIENEVYSVNKPVTFILDIDSGKIERKLSLIKEIYAGEESVNEYHDGALNIKVALTSSANPETKYDVTIGRLSGSKYLLTANTNEGSINPGKFSIKATVDNNGAIQEYTQDFRWGVLALNPNKSVYLPDETAKLSIAVLDDNGNMVCDAKVELLITDPNGKSKIYSSEHGSIRVNQECSKKDYTTKPDYEAEYKVSSPGNYQMILSATTKNGKYEIADYFDVQEKVNFEVERILATRVYPPVTYPATINIKFNTDFEGTIEEYVPESFEITPFQGESYSSEPNIKATQTTIDNGIKRISWEIKVNKGDVKTLGYQFKTPNVSPYFYLLGPLKIKKGEKVLFEEGRNWQIANDASGDIILLWDTANGSVPGGWTCISCTGGDAYYGVFPRGATSYSGSTGGADTHNDHTLTFSTQSSPADTGGKGDAGSTIVTLAHQHTWTGPTEGTGDVRPPFKNLNLIYANNPSTIPANVIGIFDTTSLPSGWTRYTTLDDKHLRGYSDNATAGSATHNHSVSVTSGSVTASLSDTGSGFTSTAAHTHTLSGSTDNANNDPPYVKVVFAYNSSGGSASLPDGLIAMFNATPPTNWSSVSGSSPYNNNFLYGASTGIGTTGGSSASHNHNGTKTITSASGGSNSNNRGTTGGTSSSPPSHTHDVTYTVGSSSATLPLYRDTIIGKYTAPSGITISGYVKGTNESTAIGNPPCDGSTAVVSLKINGTGSATASCNASTGYYEFTGVSVSQGQTITIFLTSSAKANLVMIRESGTGNITDADLFKDRVILRDNDNGTITNSEANQWDNDNDSTNMLFTAGTNMSVEDNYELHVWTGDTYDPGGTVTVSATGGSFHIDDSATAYFDTATSDIGGAITIDTSATLNVDADTIARGNIAATGTLTKSTGTPTLTTRGTAAISGAGSKTIYNLTVGDGTTASTTISNSTTITNNLSVGTGSTVTINADISVGGNLTNTTTGIITTNSGTPTITMSGSSTSIGSGSGDITLHNLTTSGSGTHTFSGSGTNTINGTVTVGTGTTLNINSSVSIAGNLTNTTTGIISYSSGSPIITMTNGTSSSIGGGSGGITLFSLSTSGTGTHSFSGSGTNLINGNVTVGSGTTLNINNSVSIAGNLTNTTSGIIGYSGTPILTMTGTSNSIGGGSGSISFYSLTINPSSAGTITLSSSASVANTLNVSSSDTLSISSSKTMTLGASSTLTLSGTISGTGTLLYQSTNTFPTGGNITSDLTLDSQNGNVTVPQRTNGYEGNLLLFNNSGSGKTYTFGTAGSQTINITGNLLLNAASGTVNIEGSTYNPAVTISGNLSYTSGGSSESITSGSGIWTIGGDVNFSNGTYTASTNNTIKMTGNGKTITSNGNTLQKFESAGTSITNGDNMDVNSTFTVSSGTFVHKSGTNVDINVAGNFTISNGANWTENTDSTSQLIFDGDLSYNDDNSGSQRSVGNVQIGTSPDTTNLASDMKANSLTVTSADFYYTNGYDLDIGNGGITIAGTFDATDDVETDETLIQTDGTFDLQSGATFTANESTIEFTGGPTTVDLITNGSFSLYNLTINGSNSSLIVEVEDALDVNNNLTITNGTLDVVSGENNQINVGGNWDDDYAFQARSGLVVMDATTGTKTIDADTAGTDAFYDIEFNDAGNSATYQLTTATDINHNFNNANGTVDANGQQINVGNNWTNSDTFTANSNTVVMDAQDAGNTLSGTMTGSSSFYNLTFDDNGTSGAWSFSTNPATITLNFTITGGAVTAPSGNLTIARNFANSDSFTHNSGTIIFNTTGESILTYSATTTFNNFTVDMSGGGGKQMKFEDTNGVVTDIDGTLTLQGADCTTGRVFLDPENAGQGWDIAASGSTNIDYIDVEYSTASPGLTAENSTSVNGNNSGWTINAGACSSNNPPNTPTNSTPSGSGIVRNPTLTASSFSDPDPGDTHANSQWQISTATGGGFDANIVWDTGTTASNLTSVVVNSTNGTFQGALSGETRLAANTTYYFRVKYQDNHNEWSSFSTDTSFTTEANVAPNMPSNNDPTNGETDQSTNPTLISSSFSDNNTGDTHANSQWQISTATGGGFDANIVWDTGTTASNLTSVVVNSTNGTFQGALSGETRLASTTTYYWRLRHQDDSLSWSNYSTITSFTTSDIPNIMAKLKAGLRIKGGVKFK